MEALNSKYEYILERGRMLTIPLVRWEDHELNKDIKQEITDENCHNNDDSILKIGKTQTIEKEVNTTNINIKSEENIIDACQFDGSVLNEDNSLEIIERPNLRNNLSCTANCRTNPRKTRTIKKEVNTTNINIKSEEDIIDACQFDGSVLNEDNSLEIIERPNLRNNLSCTANCRTNPRKTRTIKKEVNTTNINIKSEEDIIDACQFDGSVLNEDNSLEIIERPNLRNNLSCTANCRTNPRKTQTIEKEVNTTNINIKSEENIIDACQFDGSVLNEDNSLEVIDRLHLRDNLRENTSNTEYFTRQMEEPLICALCNKTFHKKSKLKKHIMRHTYENTFKCNIFGKRFSQAELSETHMRLNTEKKTHKCDICEKRFSRSNNLIVHRRTHTGEKPYFCDVCKKGFSLAGTLKVHRRTHTGEKPYSCDICDKSFKQLAAIKHHRRIHTGEKPHKCNICDKSFSSLTSLNSHRMTHNVEKNYKCEFCDKAFGQMRNLKRHNTRIHTITTEKPYKCKVCNKTFAQKQDMSQHTKIHTGEKPHSCDVCDKSFTRLSTLNEHRRIHTGEKPHSCDICNKSFTQSSTLKNHRRIHKKP